MRKCILTDHGECRQTLTPPDHQYVYLLFDDFLINVITFLQGDFIGHDESGWDIQDLRVETVLSDNRLALRIWRNESGLLPLLDLSYGSVIISDTYSEFSLMLPSPLVYGSGAGSLSFASNATESANFQK